ncbi:MAG: hypothetical protein PHV36_15280, partial [Elusimicrobiales bacterium]|nr:hypothetical protein [Elusimicrobiales bacterium]
MADNPVNLNIFDNAPPRLRDALPLFSGLGELVIPVAPENAGGATLYAVAPFTEEATAFLPAFTSESLVNPPFIKQPPQAAALLFFHAPAHEHFAFNPPHPQSRQAAAALKASRK